MKVYMVVIEGIREHAGIRTFANFSDAVNYMDKAVREAILKGRYLINKNKSSRHSWTLEKEGAKDLFVALYESILS